MKLEANLVAFPSDIQLLSAGDWRKTAMTVFAFSSVNEVPFL